MNVEWKRLDSIARGASSNVIGAIRTEQEVRREIDKNWIDRSNFASALELLQSSRRGVLRALERAVTIYRALEEVEQKEET